MEEPRGERYMSYKILINAIDPEECRIASVKDSKLEEFHIDRADREMTPLYMLP